jgi:hypothetical protein
MNNEVQQSSVTEEIAVNPTVDALFKKPRRALRPRWRRQRVVAAASRTFSSHHPFPSIPPGPDVPGIFVCGHAALTVPLREGLIASCRRRLSVGTGVRHAQTVPFFDSERTQGAWRDCRIDYNREEPHEATPWQLTASRCCSSRSAWPHPLCPTRQPRSTTPGIARGIRPSSPLHHHVRRGRAFHQPRHAIRNIPGTKRRGSTPPRGFLGTDGHLRSGARPHLRRRLPSDEAPSAER